MLILLLLHLLKLTYIANLGHVPTNQLNQKGIIVKNSNNTVITNQFLNSMSSIVAMDKASNSINLAIDANSSGITEQELTNVYDSAINGLMGIKSTLTAEKKPADMLVHNTLKQAFKRHSLAVLQNALLKKYDRVQAAKLLTFSSINSKTGVAFTDKPTQKKLNSFTTFDCLDNKIVVLGSPQFDKVTNHYYTNMTVVDVDIDQLVYSYTEHLNSLNDDIPLLTSDAMTTPMAAPTAPVTVDDEVFNLTLQVAELQLKNDNSKHDLDEAVAVNLANDSEFTKLLAECEKLKGILVKRDATIKTLRAKTSTKASVKKVAAA